MIVWAFHVTAHPEVALPDCVPMFVAAAGSAVTRPNAAPIVVAARAAATRPGMTERLLLVDDTSHSPRCGRSRLPQRPPAPPVRPPPGRPVGRTPARVPTLPTTDPPGSPSRTPVQGGRLGHHLRSVVHDPTACMYPCPAPRRARCEPCGAVPWARRPPGRRGTRAWSSSATGLRLDGDVERGHFPPPRCPVQTAPADDRRRDAHVTDGFPPGPGSGHTILTG